MSQTKNFFRASAEDFKKIPGSPVAYWVSERMRNCFFSSPKFGELIVPRHGLATSDNNRFLKLWFEVALSKTSLLELCDFSKKWFPMNKGGSFRKWYGNLEWIINYEDDGKEIKEFAIELYRCASRTIQNTQFYFKKGLTWSALTSGSFSVRWTSEGAVFGSGAHCAFASEEEMKFGLAFMNSKVNMAYLAVLSPTLNFNVDDIRAVPFVRKNEQIVTVIVEKLISISRADWDSYETSWNFAINPLIAALNSEREKAGDSSGETAPRDLLCDGTLQGIYEKVRAGWAANCEEMRRLETENNRIFIEAYGLQDELSPDVPWEEISLTCNPWYRYGVRSADDGEGAVATQELEERLRADTVKELVSYAVGCMMGRYAIDKPGLVLANQGATYEDYLAQISEPAFAPDDDGIIPILEDDCFADDIVTQFHRFLRVTFGERNFNANLSFIEDALGKDLRSYFVKDFYADHLQRYQKRPIYWLFSSPKGTFSALIYLHRYHPGTVGQVLGYLRSHITKIQSRVDAADRTAADSAATQGMKTRAIKERAKLVRQLKELEDYERDVLHPLAGKRIEIDLDDGVKANYPKFGKALRKIPGLE